MTMRRIAFDTVYGGYSHFRLCDPASTDRFAPFADLSEPDWLVVYDEPSAGLATTLPRSRRILVTTEPPGVKVYRPEFLAQFGTVVGPVTPQGFDGTVIRSHPGIPWFYGVTPEGGIDGRPLDLADMQAMPAPDKPFELSCVVSRKRTTEEHRMRLRLVDELVRRLGPRLHLFGRGIKEITDKRSAIDPYRMHLVMENNRLPHFWTEKVADAWLGRALPLYCGAPDLDRYFPADSFIRVPFEDVGKAADVVEKAVLDEAWRTRADAVERARRILLERQTVFDVISRAVDLVAPAALDAGREATAIRSNGDFAGLLVRLRRMTRPLRRRLLSKTS